MDFVVGDRIKRPRGKMVYEVINVYDETQRETVDRVFYYGRCRLKNLNNGSEYLAVNGKDVWVKHEGIKPIKKKIIFKFI
jgi:hypothetical protein